MEFFLSGNPTQGVDALSIAMSSFMLSFDRVVKSKAGARK